MIVTGRCLWLGYRVDWVTVSALATAGGTLVLAIATFSSVRSGNRSARTAERSLLAALRPLLVNSQDHDPTQKIGFADQHFVRTDGGHGSAEVESEAVYLTMSLRNVGAGVAVLHGWSIDADPSPSASGEHPSLGAFQRLTRDLYIAAGDVGFWQGALRDPSSHDFAAVRSAIEGRRPITIHLLYGDVEGGQRVVSRFTLLPGRADGWLASVARHWNIDRPDPRATPAEAGGTANSRRGIRARRH